MDTYTCCELLCLVQAYTCYCLVQALHCPCIHLLLPCVAALFRHCLVQAYARYCLVQALPCSGITLFMHMYVFIYVYAPPCQSAPTPASANNASSRFVASSSSCRGGSTTPMFSTRLDDDDAHARSRSTFTSCLSQGKTADSLPAKIAPDSDADCG